MWSILLLFLIDGSKGKEEFEIMEFKRSREQGEVILCINSLIVIRLRKLNSRNVRISALGSIVPELRVRKYFSAGVSYTDKIEKTQIKFRKLKTNLIKVQIFPLFSCSCL
jgi:hypothetical protein